MKLLQKDIQLKKCKKENIYDNSSLFSGYLDSDFKNWKLKEKNDSKDTNISVYEMDKNGTFEQIFKSLSNDLDSLCLTQGQIIEICKNQSNILKYDSWTFFLFKVDNEFFVAYVIVDDDGRLEVHVRRFSHDFVWSAECRHRFVVPQLFLEPSDSSPSVTLTLSSSEIETLKNVLNKIIK